MSTVISAAADSSTDEDEYDLDLDPLAKVAFDKMRRVVERPAQSAPASADWKPPCLAEMPGPPFPCCLCGKLCADAEEALAHGAQHSHENATPSCSLCGRLFFSDVSLSLHQMSERVVATCPRCHAPMPAPGDQHRHLCRALYNLPPGAERPFSCPLGCDTKFKFSRGEVETHLASLHGCDHNQIAIKRAGDEKVTIQGMDEFSAKCPICSITINTLNIPLNTHLIYHCPKQGPVQKELIRSLCDLAQDLNLDPDLLVRMEMQANLNDWITSKAFLDNHAEVRNTLTEEDKSYIERSNAADLKYNRLPRDFFSRLLSHVPENCTWHTLKDKWKDLPFQMKIWNQVIEKCQILDKRSNFQKHLVQFQRQVRERLKEKKGVLPWNEQTIDLNKATENQPPRDVLERLERELNFPLLDTSDMSLLRDNGFVTSSEIADKFPKPITGNAGPDRKRSAEAREDGNAEKRSK